MSEKNEQDEFHLTAITPDGDAVGIRKRGNEETLGIISPVADGQSLMPGVELVTSKRRNQENVFDLKTLYSVKKGPSKVSNPTYRKNHDRIFKNTDKSLN